MITYRVAAPPMTTLDPPEPVASERREAVRSIRRATKAGVRVHVTPPRAIVVALVGEHDLHTAEQFEQLALMHLPECDRLTIDLTETTFLDSTILRSLVHVAQHARWRGVDIRVLAAEAGAARRLLEVTGLARRLCLVGAPPASP